MEIRQSIIVRGGLAMGSIVLLALLSMISAVLTAKSAQGDADAINLAGSLRMQSYRIATRLQDTQSTGSQHIENVQEEIVQFEQRLTQLWQTGPIASVTDDPIRHRLNRIASAWRDTLKPLLISATGDASLSPVYLQQVDTFVSQLDQFVKQLVENTETKIQRLRLIQGVILLLTLALILVALYQLHTRVVVPLRNLVWLARTARGGNLSVRARHVGSDELGVLGNAFNLMAADLSALYASLEERVAQQTEALQISNRSLELLYQTARQLNDPVLSAASYSSLLTEIEKLTGQGSIKLCLTDAATRQATQAFSTQTPDVPWPWLCQRLQCHTCLGDGATHTLTVNQEFFSIPIREHERQFGVLIVRAPALSTTAAWQIPLLETVARNIAAALRANELADNQRRLALLEERAVIARELHDSLAQSLSYLKIQVSRLRLLPEQSKPMTVPHDIAAELRDGLNQAYRQLRELIATFRLKMEHSRLEDSLSETVREFSHRGQLPIGLNHSGWHSSLNPNEQIHVMQIIREALNNAVKHAHAQAIDIQLRSTESGEAIIEITDDGVGLPVATERDNHFGLHIMRERARHLGGVLSLHSPPDTGVCVRLSFIPAASRIASSRLSEASHGG
ncbi:MAG: type IV pili methyl-accepting chemotaxis transducer N-terminal domain-containing protein [Candidatus Competibacter denitrificans]|jgi:two-component system nitrate/nitrite sensor histidine kinase NarX